MRLSFRERIEVFIEKERGTKDSLSFCEDLESMSKINESNDLVLVGSFALW